MRSVPYKAITAMLCTTAIVLTALCLDGVTAAALATAAVAAIAGLGGYELRRQLNGGGG